jgi:hypothetical protein
MSFFHLFFQSFNFLDVVWMPSKSWRVVGEVMVGSLGEIKFTRRLASEWFPVITRIREIKAASCPAAVCLDCVLIVEKTGKFIIPHFYSLDACGTGSF